MPSQGLRNTDLQECMTTLKTQKATTDPSSAIESKQTRACFFSIKKIAAISVLLFLFTVTTIDCF